jgi:hypothetical protein
MKLTGDFVACWTFECQRTRRRRLTSPRRCNDHQRRSCSKPVVEVPYWATCDNALKCHCDENRADIGSRIQIKHRRWSYRIRRRIDTGAHEGSPQSAVVGNQGNAAGARRHGFVRMILVLGRTKYSGSQCNSQWLTANGGCAHFHLMQLATFSW